MKNRRNFLKASFLSLFAASPLPGVGSDSLSQGKPIIISTWNHGIKANQAAWKIISAGGAALDAVEAGVMVTENDPKVKSVGYGGYPDREGNVTLDACIMDHQQRCGSVAFLQHIRNPVAVARQVMEKTPHVMLVGEGALQFALKQGFVKENLLTAESLQEWQEMFGDQSYKTIKNIENHDTIGLLALDQGGNLSGACTTSGMANKMYGRVGDSPLIGAGLYVDNDIGAAAATGVGEAVIRHAGSAMVVELMRQGHEPGEACQTIVKRILKTHPNLNDFQVGFIALRKDGKAGAFAANSGFNYAVHTGNSNDLIDAPHAQ
ncbi:MAG: isoaspartyl peptidase/L-asparaginase family protein [Candidatus Cyclobacteriaceae bacterium M3_2C_046]